jgi:hypothetical protein
MLLAVAVFAGMAVAAPDPAVLQKRLDAPVTQTIKDKPIGDVFAALSKATGVKFVIDPDTPAYLPYGGQTRLDVTLKDVTLRNALPAMLNPQALAWEIDGETIRIVPSEPLYRMCRRATYDELSILGRILAGRIDSPDEDGGILQRLREVTGRKGLKLVLPPMADDSRKEALAQAGQALPGAVADWLDMFCRGRDLTWYLDKTSLIVLPVEAQVRRQLQRKVSLRYQNAKLIDALLDLTKKARVKLSLTPGVMNLLPARTRSNFTLILADATIDQTLEVIAGATGLQFSVTADGIAVTQSQYLKTGGGGPRVRPSPPGFFVQTSIRTSDGSEMKIFLLPDQMPEALQKAVDAERKRMMEELAKHFAPPAPEPATEPATEKEKEDE